jgi:hypothetical protein
MRIVRALVVVLGLTIAAPAAVWASGWGGIEPGETTMEQVRERYGAPSKETKQKIEGYDTATWVYEGNKAPVGMTRMTIDIGILKPDGFKPDLVRVFVLEPKPTIFPLQAVLDGWGMPAAAGDQAGFPTMLFEAGLVVVFEKQGQFAESMTFTVAQPLPQAPAAGAAPAPGTAPQATTPRGATPGAAPPKSGTPASPAAPRP